ncbi:CAP domain-containing protein [Streptomyces sp. NPDC014861]|uniref:CAP domain-containing protein n=1 Tax=Streptomyces sp. NPDC014861 TaxID=3364923 RepID=UPI0036F87DB5
MRYDGPDPSDPSDPSDPFEHPHPDHPAPGAPASPTGSGRHRRGGPALHRPHRRPLRRTSFQAAVLTAGTTAAAVTVLLGLYVAAPPSSSAPRAAGPSSAEARPPAPPTPAPGSPDARAEARRTPSAPPAAPAITAPTAPATTPPGASAGADAGDATGTGAGAGRADGGLAPQTGSVLAAPVTAPARAARYVRDVVALANAERDRAGCEPLRTEARLTEAAQGHADDMAARDFYAHDNPEGHDGGDRIKASGYAWSAWGENIHKGPKTPELAMDDWIGSPAHRANIVNCAFRDIGVGVTLTADGPWWVQDFGTKG